MMMVDNDLTAEQRAQVMAIATNLERDFGGILMAAFAAGHELNIDHRVIATAISLNALMLAAHQHDGNEASFLEMAKQALALCRTGTQVQ